MLTPEVLAQRVGKITSSLAGACLNLDDYRSPAQAQQEILGEAPRQEDQGMQRAFERGHELEATVLEWGRKQLVEYGAVETKPAPFVVHPEGWAGDSTDALYTDVFGDLVAVGEAKTVALGGRVEWGEEGTDQVPPKVFVQACWHLIHWPQAPRCIIPVLFGGYDFSLQRFIVERDDAMLNSVLSKLRIWHQAHIAERQPVQVNEKDEQWLKQRWPRATEQSLDPTPDFEAIVWEALEAERALSEAEKHRKALLSQIRDRMQDFGCSRSDTWSVTYRNDKDSAVIDWQALALQLGASPEDIMRHTRMRPGPRKLRVTALKPKTKKKKEQAA